MFQLIKNNAFIRNVTILISGTTIAQGLMILSAPLLSRLYEPEVFGVFALYSSIIGILSVMMSWHYELVIVLPKQNEDSINVVALSLFLVALMTGMVSVIIFFAKDLIVSLSGTPDLNSLLWWIPISIFSLGIYQIFNYWSIRMKMFKQLSLSQLFRGGSVASTQVSAGFLGMGSAGLIGGQVVGQVTASMILGYQVFRNFSKEILSHINFTTIKKVAIEYKRFPMYSAPQSLTNAISRNIPPILLAVFYGPAMVGFYAMALKLIQMPVNVIGESIRSVLFQRVSENYNNNGNVFSLLVKSTINLVKIAIIPSVILFLFSPKLFYWVLGADWYTAGVYARWMTVWLFFGFINIPAFVTAQTVGLQKYLLIYEIFLLIFRSAALYVGLKFFSAFIGILLFCLIASLFNLLLILGVALFTMKMQKRELNQRG
ncbi:oligosaccharide flippase family protein [Bacillus sp. 31A1R]|uniref:Oligosaccharide flippase family protein n=1 Tax=Robertmurraya mangrovi TaxID=3098077 RepID=A0ABU5ITF8_9BACI|nr:oligosaccharide flippase family protein [Bacillus sp. 31A1R]MDZ5470440.1 oligosaccharide flippase family protein [Bacillus sp. 31A1R]